jgi:hypothetical protein
MPTPPTQPPRRIAQSIASKHAVLERNLNNQTRQQKLYAMLQRVCSESSDCLILGKYTNLVKQYFHNFTKLFNFVKLIGTPSTNGFVNECLYIRDNYEAFCVLKSSQNEESDNLFFEWYIGHFFINKLVPKFPCFMETYQVGYYEKTTGNGAYNFFKTATTLTAVDASAIKDFHFLNSITATNMAEVSCSRPKKFAVLIQHMKDPMSLSQFIRQNKATEYGFNVDMVQIFLQIFIPLGTLADRFTHNDLHNENVLLYTIPNNNYITLKYILGNNKPDIEIKTRYIVKLIDYGRSYFRMNKNRSSTRFFNDMVAKDPKCRRNQDNIGYSWFTPLDTRHYYISQLESNISKDLWLPWIYWTHTGKYQGTQAITVELQELFTHMVRGDASDPRRIPPAKICTPNTTCNVMTFMNSLCDIYIRHEAYINQKYDETLFQAGVSIGQLEIFANDLTKDSIFTSRTSPVPPNLQQDISPDPSLEPVLQPLSPRGLLLKKCGDDKVLNPASNRCVKKCKDGYRRNAKFRCTRLEETRRRKHNRTSRSKSKTKRKSRQVKRCSEDKVLNPETNRCVKKCKDGFTRNTKFQCRKIKL